MVDHEQALAEAINNLAAAINKLADYDRIGHEICMGIRHGLFGSGDASNTIAGIFGDIGNPLDRLADAAESLDLSELEGSAAQIAGSVSSIDETGISVTNYEG